MVARLVSLTRKLNSKIGYLRPLQCRHFSIVESEVAHHEYLHHMPVTTFSEDEEMIRQAVRQWAREILLPVVRDMDDQGKLRPEIIASLFKNGFMGMVSVKRTNKKDYFFSCVTPISFFLHHRKSLKRWVDQDSPSLLLVLPWKKFLVLTLPLHY